MLAQNKTPDVNKSCKLLPVTSCACVSSSHVDLSYYGTAGHAEIGMKHWGQINADSSKNLLNPRQNEISLMTIKLSCRNDFK